MAATAVVVVVPVVAAWMGGGKVVSWSRQMGSLVGTILEVVICHGGKAVMWIVVSCCKGCTLWTTTLLMEESGMVAI